MVKSSPLKSKILTFSSAPLKIHQITHINFELTSQFPFKFCVILRSNDTQLPRKFQAHTFFTLDENTEEKTQFLECGTCSSEKLPNSSCVFGNYKSVCLQILHQSLVQSNITRLYLFSSNIMYYGQKQHIKMQNFEIFKCSTQNSSNYSCQF